MDTDSEDIEHGPSLFVTSRVRFIDPDRNEDQEKDVRTTFVKNV